MLEPSELFPEVPNLYEFLSVHSDMVFDEERVRRYQDAITQQVQQGDVVVDIGTGTGLLAFLCVRAGAKRVHAIERSPALRWAKTLADHHGLADRITFHAADSRDVELPEMADVIVSELIGHIAKAFQPALDVIRRIASTEQRDAGLLSIWGFILGEQMNYQEEQQRYDEALEQDPLYGEVYWYKAYSMSQQLSEELEGWPAYDGLNSHQQKKVQDIKETYQKACDLRPMAAWIVYDYACELARWATDEKELSEAEKELLRAFCLNSATKEPAIDEEYLTEILGRKRIKELIRSVE